MERCLEKIDLTDPAGVDNWHERFDLYVLTNPRIDDSNETAFYLTMVGKEAYDLLKDLAYPETLKVKKVKDLKMLLMGHLRPVHFEATERARFHTIMRRAEEPLRDFLLRLQRQASKCNFGTQLTIQLRDRIVAGVNEPEIQKRLLREVALTYEKAKAILETWDDVNSALASQISQVHFQEKSTKPQHASRQNFRQRPRQSAPSNQSHFKKRTTSNPARFQHHSCNSCGGPHRRDTCKFAKAECHSCHKIGHIAKVCRSRTHKAAVVSSDVFSQNENDFTSTDYQSLAVDSRTHLLHRLTFESGRSSDFIVDTGSPISFMPFDRFKQVAHTSAQLDLSEQTIRGVSGHSLPVKGQASLQVTDQQNDNPQPLTFVITERGPNVLGLDGLRALQVNVVLNAQTPLPASIKSLIHNCSNNTGGISIDPIKLEVDCDPIFRKARPVPYGLRPAVEQNIKDLVSEGILKEVHSSSWATPIVTPLKTDGRPRICGDFRVTINPFLKQSANTTREVEDMFQGLSGANTFSKIDLTNAFLQVPLDEKSKEFTTIHTSWGLFQYQFLPFGLTASPGIFQKVIDGIIKDLPGTRSYQDDIIVYAKSKPEHDQRLQKLLEALCQHNVRINVKKSTFRVNSIDYLGFRIDGSGIHPNSDRIKAIQKAPKPSSVKELQSVLGFLQYYSKFVKNFSLKAKPLFDLVSATTTDFAWTKEADSAYIDLIDAVVNGEVLACFQVGKPSQLIVDASQQALGAVLEQNGRPVICISRQLSKAECNYAQTQREALAIIWAVRRLHKYLYGHKFDIVTDHRALEHIFSPKASIGKASSSMLQRWAIDLSAYDYTITHRPGKSIPHADYLSRFAFREPPSTATYFVNPLPIDRNVLIKETRLAYGPVLSSLRNGWSQSARKRFPKLYAKRHELMVQADGVLLLCENNERIIIPPTCREALLSHLHIGHLGRDKMKSLARLLCWWPSINEDILTFTKTCKQCASSKPKTHPNWTPWPVTYKAMQRVHVDYCGPFLQKYYALVIEDSYSKYPEVFLTTNATAAFSQWALRRFFAREGVPNVLVSDNGTHFSAESFQNWLKKIGCHHIFTAPRHPRSNGLAENFVKILKTAITAQSPRTHDDLWQAIDAFLIQYRNAIHASTGKTPSMMLHGRNARTTANIDTTDVTFFRGNDTRPSRGLLLNPLGSRMFQIIDQDDGSLHRRHIEQINVNNNHAPSDPPAPIPSTPPAALPPLPETVPEAVPPPAAFPVDEPSLSSHSPLPLSPTPQVSPQTQNPPRRSQRIRRPPTWMDDYS